jgi:hypothetical protein
MVVGRTSFVTCREPLSVSRVEQLNPHAGGEVRDIRVNSTLAESVSEPDRNASVLDQLSLRQFRIRCDHCVPLALEIP